MTKSSLQDAEHIGSRPVLSAPLEPVPAGPGSPDARDQRAGDESQRVPPADTRVLRHPRAAKGL